MHSSAALPAVLSQAQAALRAGRGAEAERLYRQVLTQRPGEPQALLGLARLAQAAGRLEEAEELLRGVLAARPESVAALNALGLVQQAKGEARAAAESFRRAATLAPDDFAAQGNLGNALQELGDLEGAVAAYRAALDLRPEHNGLADNLAAALIKAGRTAEARHLLDGVLARDPHDVKAAAFQTVALQELGERAAADRLFDPELIGRDRLSPPAGYPDRASLNAALAAAIRGHPSLTWSADPKRRAVRSGAVTGDLLARPSPLFAAFEAALRKAIDRFVASLPARPRHPFLGRRPRAYRLSMWGNLLRAQGHQAPHVHNLGWLSGVYYVEVPRFAPGPSDRPVPGALEFGRPGYGLPCRFEPRTLTVAPRAGTLVMFPSYYWHNTVPFDDAAERISLAFDLRPVP